MSEAHGMTGKRNAARASKPSSTSIEFRCTEVEKKTIKKLAKSAGLTVSDYCRSKLLG